jgi:hypothetical protein
MVQEDDGFHWNSFTCGLGASLLLVLFQPLQRSHEILNRAMTDAETATKTSESEQDSSSNS